MAPSSHGSWAWGLLHFISHSPNSQKCCSRPSWWQSSACRAICSYWPSQGNSTMVRPCVGCWGAQRWLRRHLQGAQGVYCRWKALASASLFLRMSPSTGRKQQEQVCSERSADTCLFLSWARKFGMRPGLGGQGPGFHRCQITPCSVSAPVR